MNLAWVVFLLILFLIRLIYLNSFNVPVIILRYQGDRRRPLLIIKRARISKQNGITFLRVIGYKTPLVVPNGDRFYPTIKSPHGALVAFEPKSGVLDWCIPKKIKISKEEAKEIDQALKQLHKYKWAEFHISKEEYDKLKLTPVSEVSKHWYLSTIRRQAHQYATGWRDFFARYGGHMLVALVAILMFSGFVVWLNKAPEQAGQCIQAGVEAAKNTYLQEVAQGTVGAVTPPG